MFKRLAPLALIATVLATSGCYHHHRDYDDDDGWRDRGHRHSHDRGDRYDRRHDDRDRDWR